MHIDGFVFFCQIFKLLVTHVSAETFPITGGVIKAMDDREAKIAARFAEAEALKVKANQEAELYEKRNQLLSETKDKMLNEATMAADAKRKELMEKVREEVDQVKTRWQDMLVREQDAFSMTCVSVRPNSCMRRLARRFRIWPTPTWRKGLWMSLSVGSRPSMRRRAFRYAMPSEAAAIR